MFFSGNKVIPYPNRSIMEDVLMRYPGDYTNSTTLKDGCRDLLEEQLGRVQSRAKVRYELRTILSKMDDFDADKIRPDDDDVTDKSAAERIDYYRRLEDIKDEYIRKYARDVCIGFKVRNDGYRQEEQKIQEMGSVEDNETGDIMLITDLMEKEKEYSPTEILEAKRKLPYLLKILQDGSEKFGGSLLSFAIAREKIFKRGTRERWLGEDIRPGEYVDAGVYKVDIRGRISGLFTSKDNTREDEQRGLRAIMRWLRAKEKDTYYKAYTELVEVAHILNVELCNEDPRDYDKDFVDKAVCLYLASNEEYIESGGYGDKKIMQLLEGDNLFRVAAELQADDAIEDDGSPNMANLTEATAIIINGMQEKRGDWVERPETVRRFIDTYKRVCLNVNTTTSLSDFETSEFIVLDKVGKYFVVDMARFTTSRAGSDCKGPGGIEIFKGILTTTGHLVAIDNVANMSVLRYMDAEDAIRVMENKRERVSLCVTADF